MPETNPAPAPAPSASGDDDDDGDGDSRDGPSRPNEVESYSGDLSIPYNFQISTEGGELTPEDIADVEEALGILSQQIAEETFPMAVPAVVASAKLSSCQARLAIYWLFTTRMILPK